MRSSLVVIAGAFLLSACSSSKAEGPSPTEVYSTGVPGQAATASTQKLSATVLAVDTAARRVTLKGDDGRTQTVNVPPAVTRLDEISAGDRVTVEIQEGILFEYLPPGTPYAEPAAAVGAGRAMKGEPPGAGAAVVAQSTVTITGIDLERRIVEFQDMDGFKYQVKAGPNLAIQKLSIGDRLAATYVATAALSVEKAKP